MTWLVTTDNNWVVDSDWSRQLVGILIGHNIQQMGATLTGQYKQKLSDLSHYGSVEPWLVTVNNSQLVPFWATTKKPQLVDNLAAGDYKGQLASTPTNRYKQQFTGTMICHYK